LASKCNDYTAVDYAKALKVLYRLRDRGEQGIVFLRDGAYKERVPPNRRPKGGVGEPTEPYHAGAEDIVDEFGEKELYREKDMEQDEKRNSGVHLPETELFRIVAYTDASFAVNELMQSISGWIIYLNGTPILWGSMKQTVVVDSSCSAEYVAASITCKKVKELEHMLQFLGVQCKRPYTMYTDSTAAKAIAENQNSMGNVRHLAIRTHMTRCYISLGDIELHFCITEAMVADLFTKVVTAAQELNLVVRFYNDCDV